MNTTAMLRSYQQFGALGATPGDRVGTGYGSLAIKRCVVQIVRAWEFFERLLGEELNDND